MAVVDAPGHLVRFLLLPGPRPTASGPPGGVLSIGRDTRIAENHAGILHPYISSSAARKRFRIGLFCGSSVIVV
jgi:hypothetical protein